MKGYKEKLQQWAEKQSKDIEKIPEREQIKKNMMMGAFLFAYSAGFISTEEEGELYEKFCK